MVKAWQRSKREVADARTEASLLLGDGWFGQERATMLRVGVNSSAIALT